MPRLCIPALLHTFAPHSGTLEIRAGAEIINLVLIPRLCIPTLLRTLAPHTRTLEIRAGAEINQPCSYAQAVHPNTASYFCSTHRHLTDEGSRKDIPLKAPVCVEAAQDGTSA